MDNNAHQQQVEKQISPDQKNGEKTKLLIRRINKNMFPSTFICRHEGRRCCGSGVEANLFAWAPLTQPQRSSTADKP
jgi:hypothetical protein